jgi:hypothetical protein
VRSTASAAAGSAVSVASTMSNEALGSKFLTNVLPLYNMPFCFPESLVSQKLAKKLEGMTPNGNLFCVKNIQIL